MVSSIFIWIVNEIIKSVDNVFTRIVSVDTLPNMAPTFMIPTHLNQNSKSKFKQLNTVIDIIEALNIIPDTNPTSLVNAQKLGWQTRGVPAEFAELIVGLEEGVKPQSAPHTQQTFTIEKG